MNRIVYKTDREFRSSHRWAALVSCCCILGMCPVLWASDVLQHVPVKIAGVIQFRNLEQSIDKFNHVLGKIDAKLHRLEIQDFESTIGLKPGTMDTSKPVCIVLFRPEELISFLAHRHLGEVDVSYPVIAFTPKDPIADLAKQGRCPRRARRQKGPYGDYFLMMRDGIAFVSNKRKQLRPLRKVTADNSLYASFDADIQSLAVQKDIFLHLPLSRWREKIQPITWLAINVIKLGITAEKDPEKLELTREMANWFSNGIRDFIDQMKTVTLTLDCDGKTIRLGHHHTFVREQSVARYLAGVERSSFDLWSILPDRPFYALAMINWASPPGACITARFSRFIFNCESVAKKMSKEKRDKLVAYSRSCYGEMKGTQTMLTSAGGRFHPIQFLGGQVVDDAPKALKMYRYIQENANELMSMFMPGGGNFTGTFRECRRGGASCLEMAFDMETFTPDMQDRLINLYGENMRIQEASIGNNLILTSIAEPPYGVADIRKAQKTGNTIDRNKDVRRIQRLLPQDANAIVIVDVGRILAAVPRLMQVKGKSMTKGHRPATSPSTVEPDSSTIHPKQAKRIGPLLAWSCRIHPNALDCQFVMDVDGVERALKLSHRFYAKPEKGQARSQDSDR